MKGSVAILTKPSNSLSIPLNRDFLTQESETNHIKSSKSILELPLLKLKQANNSVESSIKIVHNFPGLDLESHQSMRNLNKSHLPKKLSKEFMKTHQSVDNLSFDNDICFSNQTITDSYNQGCSEFTISHQLSYGNYFGGMASKNVIKK